MGLMAFNHHAMISAHKGAPCDWLKLEPVPVMLDALGLLKQAPHPNAARLLVDFLLSQEGQKVFQQSRLSAGLAERSARRSGAAPGRGRLQGDFLQPEQIYDRNFPKWQKVTQELFR